ncbi:cell wall anchored protein [Venturia nashicola]|nr:cell wall anchored protein [Venturia nashicola]
MLIMGGSFPNTQECDAPDQSGTHNMDLSGDSTRLWQSFEPNKSIYNVPPEIVAKIGGDGSGGATVRIPEKDWDSNDLGVYFTRVPDLGVRTATREIPTSTSTSKPGSSTGGRRTGAIIGAALGGLVFLALLLIGCLLLLKRIKSKREENGATGSPGELDGTSNPKELYTDPKYFSASHGSGVNGNGTRAMQAYFQTGEAHSSPQQQQQSQIYEMDDASSPHTPPPPPPPRHVSAQGRSYSAGQERGYSDVPAGRHTPLSVGQGRSYSTGSTQAPASSPSARPISPSSAGSNGVFPMGPYYPASQEPAEHPALRSQRSEKRLAGRMGS